SAFTVSSERLTGGPIMASVGEARFVGKVVVVSGAANGIGRATALRFAHEGAHIVAIDREEDELATVADIIERLGRRVLPLVADWTDAPTVPRGVRDGAPRPRS